MTNKKENLEAAESYEVWGETLPWTGSGPPALAQALLEVPHVRPAFFNKIGFFMG